MNTKKYDRTKKTIFAIQVAISIATTLTVFFLTLNAAALLLVAVCCCTIIILTNLMVKLDDKFITEIVSELSTLIDTLTELEEANVFPENDDTVVSKLQNKVIRLSRILKKKNSDSAQEQENIKELVSDISHQLKTPIANLKMYSDFLKDESITPQQQSEYIDVIVLSVERLNFLSESMIKISRLESGLINPKPIPQSFNETVLKAVKDIFQKAKRKNVEITFSESGKISVCHDRNWTSEAIFNILDNAVKYSGTESTVKITLRTLGIFAVAEISDQNKKIPETEYTKIFQRFYRGSNAEKKEGIGVGLYLAREIVVRQGGYINIKAGRSGNIFSVFLPISR